MARETRPRQEGEADKILPRRKKSEVIDYQPPGWDWQALCWLGYWLAALGFLILGIVQIVEGGGGPWGLLLFLVFGSSGAFLWPWWRRERKRTAAIARFARKNGYSFKALASPEDLQKLPPLPLFTRAKDRKAKNVMAGEFEGLPFIFMDYTYVHTVKIKIVSAVLKHATGQSLGKEGKTPITQSVLVFPEMPRKLPRFQLVPKGLFNKTLDRIRTELTELDIGAVEEFTKNFLLAGESEGVLAKVFAPRIQAYFADNPTWYIETQDGPLVVFRAGQQCTPAKLQKRLDKSVEIVRTLTRT